MLQQGEIYLAQLDPILGQEQAGTRPVVIVSGNTFNKNNTLAIICPLTTKIKHRYGCPNIVADTTNGLEENSEILTFQMRCISVQRLTKKLGCIDSHIIQKIHVGLADILVL